MPQWQFFQPERRVFGRRQRGRERLPDCCWPPRFGGRCYRGLPVRPLYKVSPQQWVILAVFPDEKLKKAANAERQRRTPNIECSHGPVGRLFGWNAISERV